MEEPAPGERQGSRRGPRHLQRLSELEVGPDQVLERADQALDAGASLWLSTRLWASRLAIPGFPAVVALVNLGRRDPRAQAGDLEALPLFLLAAIWAFGMLHVVLPLALRGGALATGSTLGAHTVLGPRELPLAGTRARRWIVPNPRSGNERYWSMRHGRVWVVVAEQDLPAPDALAHHGVTVVRGNYLADLLRGTLVVVVLVLLFAVAGAIAAVTAWP
ncbi:hypothetical protein [Luteococcus peritonei]|uniref:PH domain-containing protein n=1 Tax=Luteococcus peritonei TaxID=88874 RepID=A0ABW4RY83_9ACTN